MSMMLVIQLAKRKPIMENFDPHLIPGSVWERIVRKKGKESILHSIVLTVSNEDLKDEMLEKFPQQVVFLTSKLKVLTQDVDSFLSNRTFVEMDTRISALMANVVAPDDEFESDVDIDAIDLSDEPAAVDPDANSIADPFADLAKLLPEPASQLFAADTAQESPASNAVPVFLPEVYDGLNLSSSFVSYAESPSPMGNGDTMHVLRFQLSKSLNLDHLRQIFDMSANSNALEKFVIDSEQERTEVTIDGFLEVFLEVDMGPTAFGAVYLTTSGDFRMMQKVAEEAENKVLLSDDLSTNTVTIVNAPVTITPVPSIQIIPQLTQPQGAVVFQS